MSTAAVDTPLDSLPYYDKDLDTHPSLRSQINSQLAIELRTLLPKNPTSTPTNLSHLAVPRPLPASTTMLGAELVRVQSKKPPQDGLDTTRYAMLAPTGEGAHSVSSWQGAHDNSLAQLEHQRLRSLNVTLLSGTLGANAWKVNNFDLENSVKRVEGELEETRRGVEEVNRMRKVRQETGGEALTRMENKWTELVSGNIQLEIGCMALEQEVRELTARHAEIKARLAQP
ncbi:breast carcinoma amplified sequence 2 [Meredithblackwellia eburnea MCA 4105]